MKLQIRYFITGIVLTALLAAAVILVRSFQSVPSDKTELIEIETNIKSVGPVKAPIVIVEYSDFQCPSCQVAQKPLHDILEQFPGLVRLEARHFPLQMHRYAFLASMAAECAGEFGQFWSYHDLLFQQQTEWSRDPDAMSLFLAYANDLRIPIDAFVECLDSPEIESRVKEDKKSGELRSVRSTPTFFINGERFVGSKQLSEQGKDFIKEKLEQLAGG